MMNRLNILELHRTINNKINKKNECYEQVLEKCHRKIKKAAENKNLKCLYDIPEFIIGFPLYNLTSCITYIIDSLRNNGFLVKYFFPKLLYISWDYDEINENKRLASAPDLLLDFQQKREVISKPQFLGFSEQVSSQRQPRAVAQNIDFSSDYGNSQARSQREPKHNLALPERDYDNLLKSNISFSKSNKSGKLTLNLF